MDKRKKKNQHEKNENKIQPKPALYKNYITDLLNLNVGPKYGTIEKEGEQSDKGRSRTKQPSEEAPSIL
jgi:hypothetical protein